MNNQEQTIAIFRVLQFIPDGGNMLKKKSKSVYFQLTFFI